ncbi:hypothetical protein HYS47_02875 [Candidatus Woesearchaeota archaeon]|nr:hypothetical protein [Candidatus Woesearchaeota archaeon]
MKFKRYTFAILFFIAVLVALSDTNISPFLGITGRATAQSEKAIPEETGQDTIVLFCPRDHCSENLAKLLQHAEIAHCAFFELNHPLVIEALKKSNAQLVIDGNYKSGEIANLSANLSVRYDDDNQFSHNKFCVINNNLVWTGSFNPTTQGNEKNNENAVVFLSQYLANNYEGEFQELFAGEFGKGKPVAYPKIKLNGNLVENYFCPEDHCAEHVIDILKTANESIYFMTFSFTHDLVGDALLNASSRGVEVRGVFENRQKSQYSEYDRLAQAGILVTYDTNPATMHHKVFIIDQKIVITGSFNPSKNADERNDENVIILHNPAIAQKFLEEYAIVAQGPLASAVS